jgi:hypothetical protein
MTYYLVNISSGQISVNIDNNSIISLYQNPVLVDLTDSQVNFISSAYPMIKMFTSQEEALNETTKYHWNHFEYSQTPIINWTSWVNLLNHSVRKV